MISGSDWANIFQDFWLLTDERMEIEGMLSVQEASSAVAKLHNDKSPEPEGFTSNIFKFFWIDLGIFLVRSLSYGFENGQLIQVAHVSETMHDHFRRVEIQKIK